MYLSQKTFELELVIHTQVYTDKVINSTALLLKTKTKKFLKYNIIKKCNVNQYMMCRETAG